MPKPCTTAIAAVAFAASICRWSTPVAITVPPAARLARSQLRHSQLRRLRRRAIPREVGGKNIAERPHGSAADRARKQLKSNVVLGGGKVVNPVKGHKHEYTIIYLHGCGCHAAQYLEDGWNLPWTGQDRLPGLRAVLPEGPSIMQKWGENETSWHTYATRRENRVGEFESLNATRERLARIVYSEVSRLSGHGDRVFLGGASQGCTVALDTYLRQVGRLLLGGFVGSVGFMPGDHQGFRGSTQALERLIDDESLRERPVWLQCATDDERLVPWRKAVKPSLIRPSGRLPGLYIKEVSGRGHILGEWEGEFMHEFLKQHARFDE